jgi:hypothetical protein
VAAVAAGKVQGMMGPVDLAVVKAAGAMLLYLELLTQVEAAAAATEVLVFTETGVLAALD